MIQASTSLGVLLLSQLKKIDLYRVLSLKAGSCKGSFLKEDDVVPWQQKVTMALCRCADGSASPTGRGSRRCFHVTRLPATIKRSPGFSGLRGFRGERCLTSDN